MRKYLICLNTVLILFSNDLNAQKVKADSLIIELKKTKTDDVNKLKLLLVIAESETWYKPVIGIEFADKAILLSKQLHLEKEEAKANYLKAVNLERISKYDDEKYFLDVSYSLNSKINNVEGKAENIYTYGTFLLSKGDYINGIDSIKSALKIYERTGNQFGIANVNLSLGGLYSTGTDRALPLKYLTTSLNIFKTLGNELKIATCYDFLAIYYYYSSQVDKALQLLNQSVAINERIGNLYGLSYNYSDLNLVYYQLGDKAKAQKYKLDALKINEQLGNEDKVAIALLNFGFDYCYDEDYTKSIMYFKKSLEVSRRIQSHKTTAYCLSGLASSYASMDSLLLAKKINDEALKLSITLGDENRQADCYRNYAKIYTKEKDFVQSAAYYKIAIAKSKQSNYVDQISNDLLGFAEATLNSSVSKENGLPTLGVANKVLPILNEALASAKENENNHSIMEINQTLSLVYRLKGDFKKSLFYLTSSVALHDSIENKDVRNRLNQLLIEYEASKKEQHIELLTKDNEAKSILAAKEKQKKKFTYNVIAALILFGGFTYNRYRKRKILSVQLSTSLNELKQTQQNLILSEREKEAEQLRVRISRDIHDDMGSNLSRLALQSEMLASGKINKAEDVRQSLTDIAEYSRTVINDLGEIVWSVSPQHDTLQSLLDFMHAHLDKYLKETGIAHQSDFKFGNGAMILRPDVKRNLFLVFKESINNAVKYADAKNISVEVKVVTNDFDMKISDDGKGFNIDEKINSGNGLGNICNRIKSIGGEANITSSPNNGCTIFIKTEI